MARMSKKPLQPTIFLHTNDPKNFSRFFIFCLRVPVVLFMKPYSLTNAKTQLFPESVTHSHDLRASNVFVN